MRKGNDHHEKKMLANLHIKLHINLNPLLHVLRRSTKTNLMDGRDINL
jgi:hypothetical protein